MALGSGLVLTISLFEHWSFLGSFKQVMARESDFRAERDWPALLICGPRHSRGMWATLTIRMPLRGVVAKSSLTLALGEFCIASSPRKLAAQGPSVVDPGQPLLPDVPSELPSLLSDTELPEAAANRSGMCVCEGEKDALFQAQIPHIRSAPEAIFSLGQASHHHWALQGARGTRRADVWSAGEGGKSSLILDERSGSSSCPTSTVLSPTPLPGLPPFPPAAPVPTRVLAQSRPPSPPSVYSSHPSPGCLESPQTAPASISFQPPPPVAPSGAHLDFRDRCWFCCVYHICIFSGSRPMFRPPSKPSSCGTNPTSWFSLLTRHLYPQPPRTPDETVAAGL